MPSPLESGKEILQKAAETGKKLVKTGKAIPKHIDWYNDTLPGLLSASHPELGAYRVTGSPRDTAAEYAGALDWARRSPLSADTDILMAKVYQFLNHGTTKAAKDNLKQDIAAILYGKGKTLSDKEIVDLAAKYAAENSFGRGPVDYNPELLNNEDTMMYAEGGLAEFSPLEGGLKYKDYPNKYGELRAYPVKNKKGEIIGYKGEMLPKYSGWLDELSMSDGRTMTEFSEDDERGMYPLVTPYATKEDIANFMRGIRTEAARKRALKWREEQLKAGKEPFKNPEFAMGGLACITEPRINKL